MGLVSTGKLKTIYLRDNTCSKLYK